MVTHEQIEEFICQYPVYQYAFFKPEEIEFSYRVRFVNRNVSVIILPGHARQQSEV